MTINDEATRLDFASQLIIENGVEFYFRFGHVS